MSVRGGMCKWVRLNGPLSGKHGDSPPCHHSATEMDGRGLREAVVLKRRVPYRPLDAILSELVVQSMPEDPQSRTCNYVTTQPLSHVPTPRSSHRRGLPLLRRSARGNARKCAPKHRAFAWG